MSEWKAEKTISCYVSPIKPEEKKIISTAILTMIDFMMNSEISFYLFNGAHQYNFMIDTFPDYDSHGRVIVRLRWGKDE